MDGPDWLTGCWAWVVPSALQATALLAVAWVADRLLLRRLWPQLLTVSWLLALARFFLPPDLRLPVGVATALGAPMLASAQSPPGFELLAAGFTLWLAGALTLAGARAVERLRLGARVEIASPSRAWLRALARASQRLGARQRPRVGTLPGLETPAVFGLLRPTLVLPRAWLDRPPTRRDGHALLHEFAHLERRDLWLDELGALLRALLWFHPLVWIAVARLRVLSELQCDEAVARALGGGARAYRDTLLLSARRLLGAPTAASARAFLGPPSAILLRLERLSRLGGATPRSPALVRTVSAALAVALAVCVLPMAPRLLDLRAQARQVFAAQRGGERQSCFALQAAAMALAAESHPLPSEP